MTTSCIGIKGKGFVLFACDGNEDRSVFVNRKDNNKIYHIEGNRLISIVGNTGDCQVLSDYIQRNIALNHFLHGNKQSTESIAHWIRRYIADGIRKGRGYESMSLFGGVDNGEAKLFLIDAEGGLVEDNYLVAGIWSYSSFALLDSLWHVDMEFDEALDLLKRCIKEYQGRVLYSSEHFFIEACFEDRIEVIQGAIPFPPAQQ